MNNQCTASFIICDMKLNKSICKWQSISFFPGQRQAKICTGCETAKGVLQTSLTSSIMMNHVSSVIHHHLSSIYHQHHRHLLNLLRAQVQLSMQHGQNKNNTILQLPFSVKTLVWGESATRWSPHRKRVLVNMFFSSKEVCYTSIVYVIVYI